MPQRTHARRRRRFWNRCVEGRRCGGEYRSCGAPDRRCREADRRLLVWYRSCRDGDRRCEVAYRSCSAEYRRCGDWDRRRPDEYRSCEDGYRRREDEYRSCTKGRRMCCNDRICKDLPRFPRFRLNLGCRRAILGVLRRNGRFGALVSDPFYPVWVSLPRVRPGSMWTRTSRTRGMAARTSSFTSWAMSWDWRTVISGSTSTCMSTK